MAEIKTESCEKGMLICMKNTKTVVLIVFMAMMLVVSSGCLGDKSSDTIKKWEPKNKEDAAVIGMLTRDSGYSVVEFETSKEMKNVSLGYDYYKGGKFIKDCKCGRVEQIENSKTEGLAGVAFEEGKYITFYSEKEGGGGSVTGDLEGWEKGDASGLGFAGLEDEKAFVLGEKCYIAAYVSGGNLADPDTMLGDKELLKKNKKSWFFYVKIK